MSKVAVSSFTQANILNEFRKMLDRVCPHRVEDVVFFQQSHNAAVFSGVLDGMPTFFKWYEPINDGLLQRSIDEIEAVSRRMDGFDGGVSPLRWASVPNGVIAAGAVPGVKVADVLSTPSAETMLTQVGDWLSRYVGDTAYDSHFSTPHWVKKRAALDLLALSTENRKLAQDLHQLQAARAKHLGAIPAVKGQTPRDFAPWNLHWTGTQVWGIDLEGHIDRSLAQAMARFSVFVVEQSDGPAVDGWGGWRYSEAGTPITPLKQALGADESLTDLMPFLVGDVLFERLVKWVDHGVMMPRLRRAIQVHLDVN